LKYFIENSGTSIARSIRVSGNSINSIDLYSEDGNYEKILLETSPEGYRLPDLNPGDKVVIYIWSSLVSYDNRDILAESYLPKITYDGGVVVPSIYVHAPQFYYDLYDNLREFPWPVATIIVLIICSIVGILFIFAVAAVSTIVSGRPLSTLFDTPASKPTVKVITLD